MERRIYDFPVPEGYDPALRPTNNEDRIPTEKIKIDYIQAADLADYVRIARYCHSTRLFGLENNALLILSPV